MKNKNSKKSRRELYESKKLSTWMTKGFETKKSVNVVDSPYMKKNELGNGSKYSSKDLLATASKDQEGDNSKNVLMSVKTDHIDMESSNDDTIKTEPVAVIEEDAKNVSKTNEF